SLRRAAELWSLLFGARDRLRRPDLATMHRQCRQMPRNGVTRWSKSRPPGRLQVLVEDVPLQRIRRRAGQAPHNTGGNVIKLDLTIDCLLDHRGNNRAAESAPLRR